MKRVLTALAVGLTVASALGQSANAEGPRPPSVCIRVHDIDRMSYPNDRTIVFHMWSGPVKTWRNDLPRECPGLKFEQGIAWNIYGDMVCSNMQVFYVLRRGTPCFLGNFTMVEARGNPARN